jgi:hypothetical protein
MPDILKAASPIGATPYFLFSLLAFYETHWRAVKAENEFKAWRNLSSDSRAPQTSSSNDNKDALPPALVVSVLVVRSAQKR